MLTALVIILLVIFIVAIVVGIQALVYWGIGSFICWAFAIPFTFTFWHGLAVAFIISTLTGIFKKEVIIKDERPRLDKWFD